MRMKVGPGYHPFLYLPHSLVSGRAHPVTRALVDGDKLGRTQRVQVIETPGHTRGSISFWVPSSRVAIVGDVMVNDPWIAVGKRFSFPATPREPMKHVNRESLARIITLSPRLICFGHGPPIELEVVAEVETATVDSVVGLCGDREKKTTSGGRTDVKYATDEWCACGDDEKKKRGEKETKPSNVLAME